MENENYRPFPIIIKIHILHITHYVNYSDLLGMDLRYQKRSWFNRHSSFIVEISPAQFSLCYKEGSQALIVYTNRKFS